MPSKKNKQPAPQKSTLLNFFTPKATAKQRLPPTTPPTTECGSPLVDTVTVKPLPPTPATTKETTSPLVVDGAKAVVVDAKHLPPTPTTESSTKQTSPLGDATKATAKQLPIKEYSTEQTTPLVTAKRLPTTESLMSPLVDAATVKKKRRVIQDLDEDECTGVTMETAAQKMTKTSQGKHQKAARDQTNKQAAKRTPADRTVDAKNPWGFLNGTFKAAPKNKRKSAAADSSGAQGGGGATRSVLKAPYTAGEGLEVLKDPQDMFTDMVHNQLCENATRVDLVVPLLETLSGRDTGLKIATMCSGTESPVLALDMLANALTDLVQQHNITLSNGQPPKMIQLEHVFSCEIEPFKQSYIEKNFQPPLLFRDIRELGQERAHTAYGGLARVPNTPGCVDILVAGTSCVDYSNLNTKRKDLEDGGEAGQTFMGMIEWINKAKPPIVILENVYSAPWDKMVELMEQYGYAATYQRMDTKTYYIPHTRQRGYLFAVLRAPNKKKALDKKRTDGWTKLLEKLKRNASASLDAFMLPNDDPRVLRGRARLTMEASTGGGDAGDSRAGRTDWTKCETRHLLARSNEELGDKRPLTGWSDAGQTQMPSFAWNEWVSPQVHRVHDLLDINTLRLAQHGVDNTYKTVRWQHQRLCFESMLRKLTFLYLFLILIYRWCGIYHKTWTVIPWGSLVCASASRQPGSFT